MIANKSAIMRALQNCRKFKTQGFLGVKVVESELGCLQKKIMQIASLGTLSAFYLSASPFFCFLAL
jgi:hypothetical protein